MEPSVILIINKSTVKPSCIPSWLAECLLPIWPNLPFLYTEISVKFVVSSYCLLQLESGLVCAACGAQPIPWVTPSSGPLQECLYLHLRFHPECPQLPSRSPHVVFWLSYQQKACPCLVPDNTLSHSSVPFPFFCLPECLVPLHSGIYTAFVKLQLIKACCY